MPIRNQPPNEYGESAPNEQCPVPPDGSPAPPEIPDQTDTGSLGSALDTGGGVGDGESPLRTGPTERSVLNSSE